MRNAFLSGHFFTFALIGLLGLSTPSAAQTALETRLPVLSDATSSAISLQSEYRLGRNWARILRGQAPLMHDALVYHYLEELLWDLVPHSQLQDRRLELIVLDNPTFNAFAVPGGIVGVHGGLVVAAESEDELASVLAHELAHLSQRHFAQRLEEERRNRPVMLAGVLASILIGAMDTQGGAAALSSTLAASAQAQLAFSRRNEEEADRIGMQTLTASGRDPQAMPDMFSRLQRNYRFYGQRPPEFLLTHPVTESRIADSLNRVSSLQRPSPRPYSPDFDLIRTRLQVHFSSQPGEILQRFLADSRSSQAGRHDYGVMLAAMRTGDLALAETHYRKLPDNWRQHLYTEITYVEWLLAAGRKAEAAEASQRLLALYPGSLPVQKLQARVMRESQNYTQATAQYRAILQNYPNDTDAWYELAETEGLLGNILAVHEARIEYFLLTGNFDQALRQLEFAKRERGLTASDQERLERREKEAQEIRRQMREDF
ncbi:M48 family metallopeptidase [Nitrincola tapanii]|uniref:M48 family metallopeptidase n=1 Tax=Nitrincola tapanii TaxID=1708751 RepID=UPI001F35D359|nr:M48 family metalloprotease [Nitrincola tapanii]